MNGAALRLFSSSPKLVPSVAAAAASSSLPFPFFFSLRVPRRPAASSSVRWGRLFHQLRCSSEGCRSPPPPSVVRMTTTTTTTAAAGGPWATVRRGIHNSRRTAVSSSSSLCTTGGGCPIQRRPATPAAVSCCDQGGSSLLDVVVVVSDGSSSLEFLNSSEAELGLPQRMKLKVQEQQGQPHHQPRQQHPLPRNFASCSPLAAVGSENSAMLPSSSVDVDRPGPADAYGGNTYPVDYYYCSTGPADGVTANRFSSPDNCSEAEAEEASSSSSSSTTTTCESPDNANNGSQGTRSNNFSTEMTPAEIVAHLDEFIVGQRPAKRAVAIALRNRWRRRQLPSGSPMKDEITSKNMLMVGPTGVGKTEIARRMARIVKAPFIKVEATKYTEVGFHGRDVESIMRDLVEIAVQSEFNRMRREYAPLAQRRSDSQILFLLTGQSPNDNPDKFERLIQGHYDSQRIPIPSTLSSGAAAAATLFYAPTPPDVQSPPPPPPPPPPQQEEQRPPEQQPPPPPSSSPQPPQQQQQQQQRNSTTATAATNTLEASDASRAAGHNTMEEHSPTSRQLSSSTPSPASQPTFEEQQAAQSLTVTATDTAPTTNETHPAPETAAAAATTTTTTTTDGKAMTPATNKNKQEPATTLLGGRNGGTCKPEISSEKVAAVKGTGGGAAEKEKGKSDTAGAAASAGSRAERDAEASEAAAQQKISVKDARAALAQLELARLLAGVPRASLVTRAIEAVEQEGIVFFDEIDKICSSSTSSGSGPDASAEGVQRDLLPLLEGASVSTTYGPVNTDHILFIAAGAFLTVKPSDLMQELLGRLPIQVELHPLTEADFRQILSSEANSNLLKQHQALLKTEGVHLTFDDAAIDEIARTAVRLNDSLENIGARRLAAIVEQVLDDISFRASDPTAPHEVHITAETIQESIRPSLARHSHDLRRYIL